MNGDAIQRIDFRITAGDWAADTGDQKQAEFGIGRAWDDRSIIGSFADENRRRQRTGDGFGCSGNSSLLSQEITSFYLTDAAKIIILIYEKY